MNFIITSTYSLLLWTLTNIPISICLAGNDWRTILLLWAYFLLDLPTKILRPLFVFLTRLTWIFVYLVMLFSCIVYVLANGRMFDELACERKELGFPEGTLMANVWRHMRKSRWWICGLRFTTGTTCVFVILCFKWCIAGSTVSYLPWFTIPWMNNVYLSMREKLVIPISFFAINFMCG